ncbi:sigma-70 family RNA polymerase sigma factor [Siccirubricoccus sp. KC 17139]|uniref:Sigma-70 family RNA polymerase sigma factor n=1 Tax=Siccirubricoccus soli TaxID=2899147 RepID=A0ABT1D2W9_9PROT|nr:sigma-70 family RNA polymerase sigma factor [Siccirubricoccus soli]MCO6415615.1 sigma-70 family RNA polymerase sigma factor [Siccirubricoccus soli]MCP2681747.1 sigma-70 family RNA polymerase sigma factor [Siccirubricoccus soli]
MQRSDAVADYLPLRRELVGLAYRMTGSYATAEDIAQEAFLRWQAADRTAIEVPRAWLLKATARLSLDHLKSARHRREEYVGPWLPEPVPDDSEAPQLAAAARAQDLSVAFLLTLQRLSPAERAVFILHDLFETPFAEIARLLHRTEAGCRKLAERARAHLAESTPRHSVPEAEARRISEAFLAAMQDGDEAALASLLAKDVVLHTDGGGIRPAARNLILGAAKVGRFFAGLARKHAPGKLLHMGRINRLPGFITLEPDGLPQSTALEISEGRITAIYIVRNPEKLGAVSAVVPREALPPSDSHRQGPKGPWHP